MSESLTLTEKTWAAIRRDYETTEAGWQKLAKMYGYKSSSQIRRRAAREGWQRNVEAITARLVTRAVAEEGRTIEGACVAGPEACERCNQAGACTGLCPEGYAQQIPQRGQSSSEDFAKLSDAPQPGGHTNTTDAGARYAQPEGVCPAESGILPCPDLLLARCGQGISPPRPSAAVEAAQPLLADWAEEDDELGVAKGLAEVHTRATREQVRAANKLMRAGEKVVDHITTILTSENPDEITASARRLLLGKGDNFKGIMDAAAKLMNTAASMKRRALGMNNVKGPATISPETALPAKVRMVLDQMDDEALMSLRFAAQKVGRMRDEDVAGYGRHGDDGNA